MLHFTPLTTTTLTKDGAVYVKNLTYEATTTMGKGNKKSRKTPAEPPEILQDEDEEHQAKDKNDCTDTTTGMTTRATAAMQRQLDETRSEMRNNMKIMQDQMGSGMKLIQDQMAAMMALPHWNDGKPAVSRPLPAGLHCRRRFHPRGRTGAGPAKRD